MHSVKDCACPILDDPANAARHDRQMEIVGDPAALPDAFFDALASLLLSLERRPGDGPESSNLDTEVRSMSAKTLAGE